MNIRQLELFLEICKKGSMSEAAKTLYISHQHFQKGFEN